MWVTSLRNLDFPKKDLGIRLLNNKLFGRRWVTDTNILVGSPQEQALGDARKWNSESKPKQKYPKVDLGYRRHWGLNPSKMGEGSRPLWCIAFVHNHSSFPTLHRSPHPINFGSMMWLTLPNDLFALTVQKSLEPLKISTVPLTLFLHHKTSMQQPDRDCSFSLIP